MPAAGEIIQGRSSVANAYPYEAETNGIIVRVRPTFIDEESSPEDDKFLWAYHVEIENRGKRTLQLMTRHWRVTDGDGRLQEVKGSGVVGQQPVLRPGASFEYTSGWPLTTPSGLMQGAYQFEDETGGFFEAKIPLIALDSPYDERRPS
jgi:ApaG protein